MHPHAPAHGQPHVWLTHRRVFARAQVLSGPSSRLFCSAPRTMPTRRPTPRPSPRHSASWSVHPALLAWRCHVQAVPVRSPVRMQVVIRRSFCLQLTMLGVACRCEASGSRPGRSTWAASRLRPAQGPRLWEGAGFRQRWWLQRSARSRHQGPAEHQNARRGSGGVRHATTQEVRAGSEAGQAVDGGLGPHQAAKPPVLGPPAAQAAGQAAGPAAGQAVEPTRC